MKKVLLLLLGFLLLPACGQTAPEPAAQPPRRVVCLYASYADLWLKAGGTLVGVTDDAISERALPVGGAKSVGTLLRPNLESIAALDPDLVIATPDIAAQLALKENLARLGVATAYDTADTFAQYTRLAERFLALTGRSDLREPLIDAPTAQVEAVRAQTRGKAQPTVLLLRANSSGVNVKSEGTIAGEILRDLGAVNLADKTPSLLETLSLEVIAQENPQFILVAPQGITEADAQIVIRELKAQNPVWGQLEGRWVVLQKELFHYKPNERWGEAYETLANLIYA
ncbi:MAG: ABC transporter substrate-binding protein [Oscillospiraceae bacterium]|jgi:iron complex transport system substrate-binding protein|nr:ABC transporter substrate-binding protein [Oscillospiraceae bacterium]